MWRRGSARPGGRRGGRSGGSSKRRPKEWQSAEILLRDAIAPGECVGYPLILVDELDAEYTDSTLLRCRGLAAIDAQTPAVSGTVYGDGAVGIIETQGTTDLTPSLFCPVTDADASWLWHSYYSVRMTRITSGVGESLTMEGADIEIDSKALRRLEAGDSSLWFVIEADTTSTANVDLWFGVRFIISER